MRLNRHIVIILVVSVCAATLTYVALRAALWSTPPWSMAQQYSPPHTEADYPNWFVQGRAQLFAWSAPLLCLSSALAGVFLARSFVTASSTISRSAALSVAWPAVAFPLVGYFGLAAVLFVGLAVLGAIAVLVQVLRRRIGAHALWILIPNGAWSILLFVFALSWDGVYGD